jgi:hypothetical protein
MNIEKLSEPLRADQIEFRIQSINKGGFALILAYKDARADMQRLDEAVGPLNWKREHTNNNHNCIVSIWDEDKRQWVSKEDTGTESNQDKEKGLASDSFKRACFNWGIGRELYGYPLIQVKLKQNEWTKDGDKPKATWELKLKEWEWYSEFTDGKLSKLEAVDEKGKQRFSWQDGEAIQVKRINKEQMQNAVADIVSCLESEDELGIKEIVGELTQEEQEFIWPMFNTKQKADIKTIMHKKEGG